MFRLPKNSNQLPSKQQAAVGNLQKSKGLCKYPYRKCNLVCLENYDYCLKHILEDKSAPYKPCPFLYTVSGKKCGKPAFRPERKETWFCSEHSRRTQLLRQKASNRHAPPQSQETLLASLSHYAGSDQSIVAKKEESDNEGAPSPSVNYAVNPFVEIDAAQIQAQSNQTLDYASESDSDKESAMLDSVWRAQDHESSDAESVDSQAEDPLKHAGVYTAEEVTVVIKDKMIRLQSLYIDQFRRLQHLLKERRRKYLHTLKKEKETLCSIHDQEKNTPREQKLYHKLKALNHFHKYYGEDAVLHKKALERRAQVTEGALGRTSHKGKCMFTEGGVKCGAKTLPVTKYCRKHILQDSQQVLFRACGFKRDDHTCNEPTLNVFENAICVYHRVLPQQPNSPAKMTNSKEELKTDVANIKDELKENIDEDITHTTVEASVCSENKSQLKRDLYPESLEATSEQVPVEPLPSTEPLESGSSDPNMGEIASIKTEPSKELISDTSPDGEDSNLTPQEPMTAKEQDSEEKMEVDDVKIDEDKNTSPAELVMEAKDTITNPEDELVMVDMITDVGVVEEVLESESKQEPAETVLSET